MATQLKLDPLDMWRQALSKLEGGMNALSNRGMNSEEFTQALQKFSTVSLGMQHVLDKALRAHFKRLNLASRNDIEEMAAALQRIEEKLDALAPVPQPTGPKPARTRRPVVEATAPLPAAQRSRAPRVPRSRGKGAAT